MRKLSDNQKCGICCIVVMTVTYMAGSLIDLLPAYMLSFIISVMTGSAVVLKETHWKISSILMVMILSSGIITDAAGYIICIILIWNIFKGKIERNNISLIQALKKNVKLHIITISLATILSSYIVFKSGVGESLHSIILMSLVSGELVALAWLALDREIDSTIYMILYKVSTVVIVMDRMITAESNIEYYVLIDSALAILLTAICLIQIILKNKRVKENRT